MQILWAVIYFPSIVWAIFNIRSLISLTYRAKLVLAFPCLTLLSTAWSYTPAITARRSLALILTYLLGAFFGMKYSVKQQLQIFCAFIALSVALTYPISIFFPQSIPTYEVGAAHLGDWHGVFPHKNGLAALMVAGICAFLCLPSTRSVQRLWHYAMMAACAVVLYMTHSATGIIVCAFLLFCFPVISQLRQEWRKTHVVLLCGFVASAGAAALAFMYSGDILAALGKDSSGTGRTQIWSVALLAIAKSPFLGYGYAGFWKMNPESLRLSSMLHHNYMPAHAHNGYLETLLEEGGIGLVMLVGSLVWLLKASIQQYKRQGERAEIWASLLVLFLLFHNIAEVSFALQNNVFWILFSAAVFRHAAEQQPSLLNAENVVFDAPLSPAPPGRWAAMPQ